MASNRVSGPHTLLVTGVLVMGMACARQADDQPSNVSTPSGQASPQSASASLKSVTTSKGTFSVPGKAFADGRDLEATPPLTVMQINVWDAAPRSRRVCQVGHGDELELLDAKRVDSEDCHYFRIRAKGCEGWLPETFVSEKREKTVGDKMD